MAEIPVKYEWHDGTGLRFSSSPEPPPKAAESTLTQHESIATVQRGEPVGTLAAGRVFVSALAADSAAFLRSLRPRFEPPPERPPRHEPASTRPRASAARRVARGVFATFAAFAILCVVGVAGLMLWALRDLPLDRAGAFAPEPAILLEAADGQAMGRIGQFKIADAALNEYPQHLVDAVLTIEDRRFFHHFGIDPVGIARAARRNYAAGAVIEGGSTITQQLVKMISLDSERTYTRKLREAMTAIWLEMRLSKEEILTRYLNTIYLGASAHGVPAAARLYFDKAVSDLTLAESALLAGLIKAPSQYNPLRNLEIARGRAGIVLDAMTANGSVSPEMAEQARAQPASLKRANFGAPAGTWFADWAAAEAATVAGSFAGNIRVRTTLVPEVQRLAEQVVRDALASAGEEHGITQAALVAMRPDGAVLAMVGGRDYGESQFNRAVQAERQPGSAFKLFVYLAALRNGFGLEDTVEDAPIEIDGWAPENFGGEHFGQVTLAEAFARSINTVAVRLALDVGIDQVILAARDLGIDAPLPETPSLALGSAEVSLLDLTGAYASVLAGSMPVQPWGIAALGAEEQERLHAIGPQLQQQRPLAPYQEPLTQLLQLAVEQGTGRQAALDGFAAGKTGTSQNHRDAWFVGFDESLVVGVWAGNDDGTPMDQVTGGSFPALLWKSFMNGAEGLLPDRQTPIVENEPQPGRRLADWIFQPFSDAPRQQCDYQACAGAYRSFRASDCTYQPYSGGRKLCEIGADGASDPLLVEQRLRDGELIPLEELAQSPEPDAPQQPLDDLQSALQARTEEFAPAWCDVNACAAAYNSFRASDCTYQPFGGGPRQLCEAPGSEGAPAAAAQSIELIDVLPEPPPSAAAPQQPVQPLPIQALPAAPPAQCNVADCAVAYASFRAADCTYQPLDGGPRRICNVVPGGAAPAIAESSTQGAVGGGIPDSAPQGPPSDPAPGDGGGNPGGDPGSGDPGAGDPGGGDPGGGPGGGEPGGSDPGGGDPGGAGGGDAGGGDAGGNPGGA